MRKSAVLPRRPSGLAFTLIELLVVIAIITILAALLLPALSKAKAAGLSAACKSNLHQIGITLKLYSNDFQKYPLCAATDPALPGSVITLWDDQLLILAANNRGLFICPADKSATKWTSICLSATPAMVTTWRAAVAIRPQVLASGWMAALTDAEAVGSTCQKLK
jgi:prepilin-type N-terminal cleavage/methylation domain-containing protein